METMTCAFTGHRPAGFVFKKDENHPDCRRIKTALGEWIRQLAQGGVHTFITGMAQGTDLWAAEEVLTYKQTNPAVRLVAAVPCESQAERWEQATKQRYLDILARCDERVLVQQEYTPNCMMKRNRWMVTQADVIFAVYAGGARGGTAATVRYAQKKGKEIFVLDPVTFAVSHFPPAGEQMTLL